MRFWKHFAILVAVTLGIFSALRAQQKETFAWAPLPAQPNTPEAFHDYIVKQTAYQGELAKMAGAR